MDGASLMYSFNNAAAPNAKERQHYEMFGNRAIWVDGWKARIRADSRNGHRVFERIPTKSPVDASSAHGSGAYGCQRMRAITASANS
jgi:arylsulfatase A-like enzyme